MKVLSNINLTGGGTTVTNITDDAILTNVEGVNELIKGLGHQDGLTYYQFRGEINAGDLTQYTDLYSKMMYLEDTGTFLMLTYVETTKGVPISDGSPLMFNLRIISGITNILGGSGTYRGIGNSGGGILGASVWVVTSAQGSFKLWWPASQDYSGTTLQFRTIAIKISGY